MYFCVCRLSLSIPSASGTRASQRSVLGSDQDCPSLLLLRAWGPLGPFPATSKVNDRGALKGTGARWEGHSRIQDEIEVEVTITVIQLA